MDYMKRCIWCNRTSEKISFNKKAHVIPQALGGIEICDNVCDDCNKFFGSKTPEGPAIEEALKETFHISRVRFLAVDGEIGRNKAITKPDSLYFKVDLAHHKVSLKLAYKIKPHFQDKLGRLLKRGLYKMFLEETEREFKNGHDSRFDFIREFARYDLSDYPVYYFQRKHGIVLLEKGYGKHPKLYFKDDEMHKFMLRDLGFFEFDFMGHVFALATSRTWQLTFDLYLKETKKLKTELFTGFTEVKNFNDIDLTFKLLN
jgi:hypothetical protein